MNWMKVAAVLGALGVIIGAFGAHGLKVVLEETGKRAQFETGVHYHFFHALALLGVALLLQHVPEPSRALRLAPWFFLFGVAIFSGTLYLLAISGKTWLGAITPIGGVLLIAGWVALFLGTPTR